MNQQSAPDPFASSMTQAMFDNQAAETQKRDNMTNQSTPYGSLTYSSDPNSPSGYSANQTLSPEQQQLYDANMGVSQGTAGTANDLLKNAGSAMSTPLDLSYGANAQRISDLQRKTLDPMWTEKQNTFDQTMANRGLVPGSAAYDSASRDFGNERSNAYDRMFLDSYNTTNQAAQNQYNSPFAALSSLRTGSQPSSGSPMGFTTTPQESIQAPNYMGAAQSAYQANSANGNAAMGGLFGMGGSLIKAGLPFFSPSSGMSVANTSAMFPGSGLDGYSSNWG